MKKAFKKVVPHLFLIVIGITFLMPFIFLLSTSVKTNEEAFDTNFHILPYEWHLDNYRKVFDTIPYLKYTLNTLFVTALSVVGQLISCPLVAYSVSKVRWAGRKALLALITATMLIPYQVTMIPVYLIWNKLKFMNTYVPLILPNFFGGAFYILIVSQFFKTLPDSLIEAAKMDGASDLRSYLRIVLPLSKAPLATVCIFTFLNTWSDFLGPLLYLNEDSKWTLSLGLQQFVTAHAVDWSLLMAASAMFTIPIIVIFFFAQKYFVEGIVTTGLKG